MHVLEHITDIPRIFDTTCNTNPFDAIECQPQARPYVINKRRLHLIYHPIRLMKQIFPMFFDPQEILHILVPLLAVNQIKIVSSQHNRVIHCLKVNSIPANHSAFLTHYAKFLPIVTSIHTTLYSWVIADSCSHQIVQKEHFMA